MDYWDTSALFKLYAEEPDSEWFSDYLERHPAPIYSSAICAIEIPSAAYRQLRAKNLNVLAISEITKRLQIHRDAGRLVHIPCSADVVSQAQRVVILAAGQSHPLMIRSLDAIHVASALAIRAKTMIATDIRVRAVARLSGLKLIPS
ncbi:MAG: type II toxin-antitoxin system VapC family toxin [Bryobacteraceae bacterium]